MAVGAHHPDRAAYHPVDPLTTDPGEALGAMSPDVLSYSSSLGTFQLWYTEEIFPGDAFTCLEKL